MKNKIKNITEDVTKSEIFHFGMLGAAQSIMYKLWNGQMMFFYTDVFMLAPLFISGMFLASRIWDAINDPLIAMYIERSNTKFGRFKNAMVLAPIPLAIALILCFTVPSFGETGNCIYAVITYILFGMIYTSIDVSFFSLPTGMSMDTDKRASMLGFARLCTGTTSTIAGIIIIPCVTFLGKGDMKSGYFLTAIIFGVFACIIYFINSGRVHERFISDKPKFDFKKTLNAVFKNKPLLMVMIFGFILQFVSIVKTSLNMYYATYNLGNTMIVSYIGFAGIPGMLLGTAVAPMLIKKFDAKHVGIGLNILFLLDSVFMFIFENNLIVFLANNLIFMFYMGAGLVLISAMTADTIEYAELKIGQRNEGFVTSTQTFISKLAAALGSSAVLSLIAILGYVPNEVQSESTLKAFFYLESIIPGVIGLLACIPIIIYPLSRKEYAKITEQLAILRSKKEANN